MQRIIEVEDLDNYIRNYRKNIDRCKLLDDEMLVVDTELNRVGGGIVRVSKDQPKGTNTHRAVQLFHELSELQDRRAEFQTRVNLVDEFLKWLEEMNETWLTIVEYRINDWSYEQIGVKVNYSFNGVRKNYFKAIKSYMRHKSVNYTTLK